jgi:hypothetical protein
LPFLAPCFAPKRITKRVTDAAHHAMGRCGDSMDKTEALAERARLQDLLDAYEAGRVCRQEEGKRGQLTRKVTPDRAGNVRARIERLDQLITKIDRGQ